MSSSDPVMLPESAADAEERAAQEFLRARTGPSENASEPEANDDPIVRVARDRVDRAWRAVGEHASSPELMSAYSPVEESLRTPLGAAAAFAASAPDWTASAQADSTATCSQTLHRASTFTVAAARSSGRCPSP